MRLGNTYHSIYTGLLSLAPLFLLTKTASQGVAVGLLTFTTLMLVVLIIYPMRNLFVPAYRILLLLIINSTLIIILSIMLEAYAYALLIDIGVFFPLIAINGLILSRGEMLFTEHQLKEVIFESLQLGSAVLLVFICYGAVREFITELVLFGDVSVYTGISFPGASLFAPEATGIAIFNTSAGALFLLALVYAFMSIINNKYFANEKGQLEQG